MNSEIEKASNVAHIGNFRQKKLNAEMHNRQRDENALQQRMFSEMDAAGLLKVTTIGASVDVYQGDTLVARILCTTKEKGEAMIAFMNPFFIQHKMRWAAKLSEQQFF